MFYTENDIEMCSSDSGMMSALFCRSERKFDGKFFDKNKKISNLQVMGVSSPLSVENYVSQQGYKVRSE